MLPERLRPDKSKVVTWFVLGSHLMPDHEHQTGWKPGLLENAVVGSQSWNELRGSLSEDFIERRDKSWRGGVEAAAETATAAVVERTSTDGLTRIKTTEINATWKKMDKRFMVLGLRC